MSAGIIKLVSKADRGQYKTISQVAQEVGRSESQIKKAIRSSKIPQATARMKLGRKDSTAFVWLYTDEDIKRYQKYFAGVKIGPPFKKKTDGDS